jgi:hypothetical protein
MLALLPLALGAPRFFIPLHLHRQGNAPTLISPVPVATPVMQAPRMPTAQMTVPAVQWAETEAELERSAEADPPSALLDEHGMVRGAAAAAILLSMVTRRTAALAIDGNEDLRGFKKVVADAGSKAMAMAGFIFPFVELMTTFGSVLIRSENAGLRRFYGTVAAPLVSFYIHHVYLWFIGMVAVFLTCSRGARGLSKFVRFNVVQGILLSIMLQCFGASWPLIPVIVRESFFGKLLQEFFFLGGSLIIAQSLFLIAFGRYPKFPVLTGAARLQVQRRDY